MKKKIFEFIDSKKMDFIEMSKFIYKNPEIGLEEYKSSKCIIDYLENNNFKIERGLSGYSTAFKATYIKGNPKVSIGLLCEYDALENIGHACGHHMQGPSIVAAAVSLKEVMKNENFKIVVYGTPAEETIGGKIKMVEDGYFKDIDVALMMHGSTTTTTDIKSLAMTNFTVKFYGRSSHAALAPEKGRSALDGLLLLFQGIEFLREHVKDDVRIHYTISNGGGPANIVPEFSEAKLSIRSYERDYLNSVIERFKNIVKGASLMTETSYEIIETKSLNNKIPVFSLNNLIMDNAKLVKAPRISEPREKTGSTDFGNVMFNVPGSCIRIAFAPIGTSSHSKDFLEYGKSKECEDAIIYASKILAGVSFDLINDSNLLASIKEEFIKNKKSANKIC